MSAEQFTLENVRLFFIKYGGKSRYIDLLNHFRKFLDDPVTKDLARTEIKTFIKTLAIVKVENGEKILILKEKYFNGPIQPPPPPSSNLYSAPISSENCQSTNNSYSPLPLSYADPCLINADVTDSDNLSLEPPPVPPRKVLSNRLLCGKKIHEKENKNPEEYSSLRQEDTLAEGNENLHISVRERTQKFNKMLSQPDLSRSKDPKKNLNFDKNAGDDDDAVSVTSTLDPITKDWFLAACRGDYHTLARMLLDYPWLSKKKTALHWAAKHDNTDMVKLLAGTYGSDVNAKSHGGYTPLHIAMQSDSQAVFDLLTLTYNANINIRDYSGKKPHQYSVAKEVSCDSSGSEYKRKRRKVLYKRNENDNGKRHRSRDHGSGSFLRIGSLNVRVKKTTEVLNNLLTGSTLSKHLSSTENLHAITDVKRMPPPKSLSFKKKKKPFDLAFEFPRSHTFIKEDSDSDSACGFGIEWS